MGLTASLSNALSGLLTTQDSISVLSRNVSNSGTPGYHRESVNVIDKVGSSSAYAVTTGTQRAFSQSLQVYYNNQVSDSSKSDVTATYLNQLQTYLGQPGGTGSLDTVYGAFQNAVGALSTSPDDYTTRAGVVSTAQTLASTLNQLTSSVQGLRQQVNGQIAGDVQTLNQSLTSLVTVNKQLGNLTTDSTARASLLDQRDRLVAQVAGAIDVNVTYRDDGTVALATKSGVGLLDQNASTFSFQSPGSISANSQYNTNNAQNGVGTLILTTPSGLNIDMVKDGGMRSGELTGLITLRDKTLVDTQNQLDMVAASLSKALSTVTTPGTVATSGAAKGFTADISGLQSGDDFTLNYSAGGATNTIKVVRVDDTTKLPMDYTDSSGARVLGVDFSGGATAVASALQTALGTGFAVTVPSGSTLQVLNDGTTNNTVGSLTTHATATTTQNAGLGVPLFVDAGNQPFTGSLDGQAQALGFAGRITVNSAIVADNTNLATPGGSLGDASRANYLSNQLRSMAFSGPATPTDGAGGLLSGNVSGLISQTMNYQGNVVANAMSQNTNSKSAMDALNQRMTSDSGVDVNSEMASLIQLQTAYSANARVVTSVQTLLDTLMHAFQ
ncbi:MAG: flgK [Hyphomicrobiales bacterium]|nr:flgK [Hyphomicrobiales bacterium]